MTATAREAEDLTAALGAFDDRILSWLANWEPETCAVVAGLIARPYASGAASVARRNQGYWLDASHRVTCRRFRGNGD